MRPISYEIRRTLTSKFVIIMIVAIVGLSALLAYEAAASYNSPSVSLRTPSVNTGYFMSGSNITLVTYSYDPYGAPYSDLHISVTSQNGTTMQLVSSSQGYANTTFTYDKNSSASITYNYSYSVFGRTISASKSQVSVNPGLEYSGYSITRGLFDKSNTSNLGFEIMYVGPNGTAAPDTHIAVATYPDSGLSNSAVDSNATYSTNASGFTVKNVFPTAPSNVLNGTYAVAISTGGHYIGVGPTYLNRISTYTPMTQKVLQSLVFAGMGPILSLLIPILGVFAAYLTYGKDRTTGVLESVLKRPVTRQGLISSRFAANAVSIVIAVIVSMLVGDLIIEHYFHMGLSSYFMSLFIWTYVVEGLAFLALIYMFSHMVKSQGALLGITIAVFVVLSLFWSIIPAVVLLVFHVSAATAEYIFISVGFNYASPAGYSTLVQFHLTNNIGALNSVTANPALYAVTLPLLVIAGILWIAVPFGIAYYISKKYD